ncbi:MAG: neocarzinostatin apoprotein domain-containing protein [Acidimicrobiales bacterium]
MLTTRGLRVALSVAVLALSGLSSGILGATSASAAATPKIVVTPSKNLKNGEKVSVAGSGFKPGDTVFLVECLVKAKGEAGCEVNGIPPQETITATGLLPRSTFKVVEGTIGDGKCGTTKANLKNCAVSVGNATGGDSAVAPIAFKAPLAKKK